MNCWTYSLGDQPFSDNPPSANVPLTGTLLRSILPNLLLLYDNAQVGVTDALCARLGLGLIANCAGGLLVALQDNARPHNHEGEPDQV
ncbi:Hypothetical predicted protein [Olea europaea subsp. europaea]|uniref:Uncharacterized protein n=1 Tax=Olea europaea subsp. europaea TaxID=158383 RepID=A0A8S0RDQ8_OLEEU|nr:Hypothetical predicted protein [Olea europaea subsp. europaea]